MSSRAEYILQQKVAKALYKIYGDCADGFIGFTYIAVSLYTPDIVILSLERMCKDLHIATIFEVKAALEWESLGQLYRYSLYAPTYIVVPIDEADKLRKREYTLFQTLKNLGIGVATVDLDKEDLGIVLEPSKSFALVEHTLYDAIAWQAFIDLLRIPPLKLSRAHKVLIESSYESSEHIINVNKVPSKEDKQAIRALVNALSLQKKALPLAENPLIAKLLDPGVLKLSLKEFIRRTLLSKPFVGVVSFVLKMMRNHNEAKPLQQCYIPTPLLLIYTKGLPLQMVGISYNDLCQRIYENLNDCYKNIVFYLSEE